MKLMIMSEIQNPSKYYVYILNDDFTPIEFLTKILSFIFEKDREEIENIIELMNLNGKAPVDYCIKEIAIVKKKQVERNAKTYGFPLKAIIDKKFL